MKLAKTFDFPPGYGLALGGAGKDQKELFTQMLIALLSGIGLMYLILVMQFGSFTAPLGVMLSLPLSLIGVVLALLLTKRHPQPDELHRHHHADGPGGEERDPAARCGASPRSRRHGPRRSADGRRPHAPASDPDDDLRADRRHAAGGAGLGDGRRVLPAAGDRDHRRHDHLDLPDPAGGADLLRQHRDRPRPHGRQVPPPRERFMRCRPS
jgi:hypothetical protein